MQTPGPKSTLLQFVQPLQALLDLRLYFAAPARLAPHKHMRVATDCRRVVLSLFKHPYLIRHRAGT